MPVDELFHPPVAPSSWWWLLVAGLVVASALLSVLALVLRRRARRVVPHGPTMEDIRDETLRDIDALVAAHSEGRISARQTCLGLSRLVRSFTGRASDGDADFSTADELRLAALADHRLEPTASFTADIRAACFSPSAVPDVTGFTARAREVVAAWR